MPAIQVNQLGFYPQSEKLAVVTGENNAEYFYVVSVKTKDTVYRAKLSAPKKSSWSSTITRIADFTALKTIGNYFITIPAVENSYSFHIGKDVYADLGKAVLKGFYYQRSGISLTPQYAGIWSRAAGHPDTIVYIHASAASTQRPEGTIISSPKGWYDAGDYNKYIVNSGITMATLFSAYEDFPAWFNKLRTNIPESNDAIPDILNEAIYNLRWMLTMQDPFDGGVYHKCTNAVFDPMIMPDKAWQKRFVVKKTTAATLDFAAVMAQAARICRKFEKQLSGLSDSCSKAAIKAWDWALQNPDTPYDQKELNKNFQPEILTGEYGDRFFTDEWFWAACELFATTKDKKFFGLISRQEKDSARLPSWGNVAMLGYYSMIRLQKDLPSYAKQVIRSMKNVLIKKANEYLSKMASNAFATVMGQSVRDFAWGSNAVAANQGILLINVYRITNDRKYLQAAMSNLDYLLGRNATGYCFVTGFGSRSPMHPHHRPSIADGIEAPVPGLLAGGPNPGRQDHCTYPFTEPETSYVDSDCAYASNEIAINWNAPMVYLVNAIEATEIRKELSN